MANVPRLRMHNVSKAFPYDGGSLLTLDGVSFTVAPQEFVALIGPSGCGKSTLLEIICGLQSADSGWIEIDGRRADSPGKHVAYMPQADLLFPWRRTLENIIVPQIVQGVPKREAQAKARRWLPLFGLEQFEEAYPGQLSGGMRQRAALLRTFLTERDIVALDEPFGALDSQTRRTLQEWLAGLRDELGRTILLITHDVEEALLLADRVIVLSSRPARVVAEIAVTLPRPRKPLAHEFVALKGRVLGLLDRTGAMG